MKSLFYKIIYASNVNFILRNILKIFNYIFGFKFILHPSGIVKTILKNNKVVYFKTNQTAYVTVRIFWHLVFLSSPFFRVTSFSLYLI